MRIRAFALFALSLIAFTATFEVKAQITPAASIRYYGRRSAPPFACTIGRRGYQYYDTDTNTQFFCNGTAWTEMGAGGGGGIEVGVTPSDGTANTLLKTNGSGAVADATGITHDSTTGFLQIGSDADSQLKIGSLTGGTEPNWINFWSGEATPTAATAFLRVSGSETGVGNGNWVTLSDAGGGYLDIVGNGANIFRSAAGVVGIGIGYLATPVANQTVSISAANSSHTALTLKAAAAQSEGIFNVLNSSAAERFSIERASDDKFYLQITEGSGGGVGKIGVGNSLGQELQLSGSNCRVAFTNDVASVSTFGVVICSTTDGGVTTPVLDIGGGGGAQPNLRIKTGGGTADAVQIMASDGTTKRAGWDSNGVLFQKKGADVASAAAITPTGNLFHVTGTTNITSITSTDIEPGTMITIIFDGVLTFTDGSNLKLAGNFVTTADDTITLWYDGTNWYEKSRAVN